MHQSIRDRFIVVLVVWQITVLRTQAHSRWVCPKSRDPDLGSNDGPCGSLLTLSSWIETTRSDVGTMGRSRFVHRITIPYFVVRR